MPERESDPPRRYVVFAAAGVLGILVVVGLVLLATLDEWEHRGQFGDMFGAANALFSGLAFAGVIWAILLQKQELRLQREELEQTRAELRGQKEQLGLQREAMERSRFEETFFRMVGLYHDRLESVCPGRNAPRGRMAFADYLKSLKQLESRDPMDLTTVRDELVPGYVGQMITKYLGVGVHIVDATICFETLHELLAHVERAELDEGDEATFVGIVRAQLSAWELALLFYYAADSGELKRLIEKYKLFGRLPFEQVLHSRHLRAYDRGAFGPRALPA